MRKLVLLVCITPLFLGCYSQVLTQDSEKFYKLEDQIVKGDRESLKKLAKYLDDTSFVQEFLGYHNYPNTARGVAKRIIEENCLFTQNELSVDSTISANKFLKVLEDNKVVFDEVTGMFLITSLDKRTTTYQVRQLSKHDLERIDTSLTGTYPGWYYENQIDGFLFTKNPEALKWIASSWFKHRSRFNKYYFKDEEFLDLIRKLTHVDIGTPGKDGQITFLYKDDYYAKARLNYLIYWVNHYNEYKWNEEKKYFENNRETGAAKTQEEVLFSLLNAKSDSIAIDAFTKLTELDTDRVRVLADEYEKNSIRENFKLPTFPYRFLSQLVVLTQYCRDNGVRYKTSGWLVDSLKLLQGWPDFEIKYRVENNIIDRLTPDEVTMVEYFGLINENEWNSTYSMGRILDKFYSKKWTEAVSDEKRLLLFLKKANLFFNLGIVGNAGKYLRKFENCSQELLDRVKRIAATTNDPDIERSAATILSIWQQPNGRKVQNVAPKIKIAKYGVDNLEKKYQAILKTYAKKEDRRWQIKQLLAGINYAQLGHAVTIMMKDTNAAQYENRYWTLENDFGLDIGELTDENVNRFLALLATKTEYEVYEYYLKQEGPDCLDKDGNLIFPKVYDALKYDIVDAFVGGGGSRREKGIYPLIKLLELKFRTRLGFPEKLCESEGVYSCNCTERAKRWMQYLEEQGIVAPARDEPPSISFND